MISCKIGSCYFSLKFFLPTLNFSIVVTRCLFFVNSFFALIIYSTYSLRWVNAGVSKKEDTDSFVLNSCFSTWGNSMVRFLLSTPGAGLVLQKEAFFLVALQVC